MNKKGWMRNEVFGDSGYATGLAFTSEETNRIKELISEQWLENLQAIVPQHRDEFAAAGIENYHKLSHLLDHATSWPVKKRILPQAAVTEIRTFSAFKSLEAEFGAFALSRAEGLGREELVWRLVRPGHKGDVGPLHADIWFHRVTGVEWPPNTQTVKVWCAICVETGLSGLRIVPGSHLREWEYTSETRHGLTKPQILEDESKMDIRIFESKPGDCIVFHENLLHGGIAHDGQKMRVSMEFTMLVPAA